MRPAIYLAAAVAVAACAPGFARAVLASGAAVILESLPYLTLAALIAPIAGRYGRTALAYAGCGCGGWGAARSIPAALATAAVFGIPVALVRVAAAMLASRHSGAGSAPASLLASLEDLAPAALAAGVLSAAVPMLHLERLPWGAAFAAGVATGVVASPCALGGVAVAAALRACAPGAAWGMLCSAGIIALPRYGLHRHAAADPWAYGLLGVASALAALRGGGSLVHPHIAIALAAAAPLCALFAWRARTQRRPPARAIGAGLIAALVIGAPAPVYHATESTLYDGFPGERITFTGVAVHRSGRDALVRYAITCCRADAAPVVLPVDRDLAHDRGEWFVADGILVASNAGLRLRVSHIRNVAPPADPFVYR